MDDGVINATSVIVISSALLRTSVPIIFGDRSRARPRALCLVNQGTTLTSIKYGSAANLTLNEHRSCVFLLEWIRAVSKKKFLQITTMLAAHVTANKKSFELREKSSCNRFNIDELLKLVQDFLLVLGQVTNHARVAE